MEENFLADKPINEEKDDKFQRYNFSKRIAETITNRTSSESIVIGLYGAWGEGKTSVLNFIKQELNPHYPNVIHFTFNPWRFTDEASLLTSFFNALASELKKSIDLNSESIPVKQNAVKQFFWGFNARWKKRKGLLKTDKELVGDLLQQYGKYASIFSVGKAAVDVGKAISNIDIEKLKDRIEKLLTDNKKRIVVFIDDIDRLDKNEIHAIFRLVKLTGDFAYTTYLLSFDENIVSSAIGERFGSGDQKAGLNFLEKIIQIPIKLPLAQKPALKDYCFELIDQSLKSSQINLTNDEAQEFVNKFTSNFLARLSTPRLAVRYGNALSFSLPLLKGEVNYIDLLLIEAIRVFYPELYDFVKTQPEYFIGEYGNDNSTYTNNPKNEKAEKFKKLFEEFTINYLPNEREYAKGALMGLFPNTEKAWGRSWDFGRETPENRYNKKRISTTQYFNRYFSYTVIKGDISDVAFDTFIDGLTLGEYNTKIDSTRTLLESATPENFITKLRFKENTFNSDTSVALVKVLTQLGDYFPDKSNLFYSLLTPFSQASIFIAKLIRTQVDEDKKYQLIEWVIQNTPSLEFAFQIFNYCRSSKDEEKKLFTDSQYNELATKAIERAKLLSPNKPIWESFTLQSKYMLNAWAFSSDKNSLDKYISDYLNNDSNYVISFLKVFVGYIHSSASPKPYYGDFEKQSYEWLTKITNSTLIYEKVKQVLNTTLTDIDKYEQLDSNQTDENMMRQFAYWYNKDANNTTQIAQIVE